MEDVDLYCRVETLNYEIFSLETWWFDVIKAFEWNDHHHETHQLKIWPHVSESETIVENRSKYWATTVSIWISSPSNSSSLKSAKLLILRSYTQRCSISSSIIIFSNERRIKNDSHFSALTRIINHSWCKFGELPKALAVVVAAAATAMLSCNTFVLCGSNLSSTNFTLILPSWTRS